MAEVSSIEQFVECFASTGVYPPVLMKHSISDLSGRSHSVCHFLGIHELSIGFTLTPMAARRVIIGHISRDDKVFQEEDALTRSNSLWFAEVKDGSISAAESP